LHNAISSIQSGADTCCQSSQRNIRRVRHCNYKALVLSIHVLLQLPRHQEYLLQTDIPSVSSQVHDIQSHICNQDVSQHPREYRMLHPAVKQETFDLSKFHVQNNRWGMSYVHTPFRRIPQSIGILPPFYHRFPCLNIPY